jgi:hypothetical protein
MTKYSRTSTGKYSVAGKTYEKLIGSRAQVWHHTAYKTTGDLCHNDLMKNKAGHIVSKSKHNSAKREKRLVKAGYVTKKGHFGFIKNGKTASYRKKGHRRSRRHHGGNGVNYALNPTPYDGKGQGLNGNSVDVQFIAGNGN